VSAKKYLIRFISISLHNTFQKYILLLLQHVRKCVIVMLKSTDWIASTISKDRGEMCPMKKQV